jgi:4-hydroxybenzoate polyprenyltransferase
MAHTIVPFANGSKIMSQTSSGGVDRTDIPTGNWVDRWLPPPLRPYARLARWDRPIGTWLLLLPCWWGVALFGHGAGEDLATLIWYGTLFGVGAMAMRGAGCTWNDITDRHIDGKVARTATRPIPSGAVSVKQALAFIVLQALVGLAVLTQFTLEAAIVAVASLGVVCIYPFMKRFTYFPQAFLGIAFNWGVLVAGALLIGSFEFQIALLYIAGFCWTMSYDTIYAHQDKEDDILIGVKSTALKFGAKTRPIIAGFMAATLILIAAAAWLHGAAGPLFWVGLAGAAAHFVWQLKTLDFDDPANLIRHFKGNRDTGLLVTAGLALGMVTL